MQVMPNPEKVTLVQGVADRLKGAQSVVLTDFQGINVADMTQLRSDLRDQSVELKVIKNRLLRLALAEAGCDVLDEMLTGNTAVAFGVGDPVAPAKVLTKFAKDNVHVKIKGGLLEGKRLDLAGVESLAKMPGRSELLATMARDLKYPATQMAMVFQASLLKLAHGMNALARKKEESGAAA